MFYFNLHKAFYTRYGLSGSKSITHTVKVQVEYVLMSSMVDELDHIVDILYILHYHAQNLHVTMLETWSTINTENNKYLVYFHSAGNS